MESMFHGASAFNQPLNDWRVDNVTDMCGMFEGAWSFDQPLNDWRVNNVTNMQSMFSNSSLNRPLDKWRVDNVTDMRYMFAHASSTSSFNQPLNDCPQRRIWARCSAALSQIVRPAACAPAGRQRHGYA